VVLLVETSAAWIGRRSNLACTYRASRRTSGRADDLTCMLDEHLAGEVSIAISAPRPRAG